LDNSHGPVNPLPVLPPLVIARATKTARTGAEAGSSGLIAPAVALVEPAASCSGRSGRESKKRRITPTLLTGAIGGGAFQASSSMVAWGGGGATCGYSAQGESEVAEV
ncbi:unnamed protein product, partial [Discosporangium mesarthrocarpum]